MTMYNPTSIQTTRPLIAIYCGSRLGNQPVYQQKSLELIQVLTATWIWYCLWRS